MAENPNQPRPYDAVLGGQNLPVVDGAVLGGLPGVKRRLTSTNIEQQIAALKEALHYGEAGLDLVIQALKNESKEVQWASYCLIKESTEPRVQQPLREYLPLISVKGVDYTRLRDLLAAGKWKEADAETARVMFHAVCGVDIDTSKPLWRHNDFCFNFSQLGKGAYYYKPLAEEIEKMPAQDLWIVDKLWVLLSNGRFGFSVQLRLWEKAAQEAGFPPDIYKIQDLYGQDYLVKRPFGSCVGWNVGSRWLQYDQLNFTSDAPVGHLPGFAILVGGYEGKWGERAMRLGNFFYSLLRLEQPKQL